MKKTIWFTSLLFFISIYADFLTNKLFNKKTPLLVNQEKPVSIQKSLKKTNPISIDYKTILPPLSTTPDLTFICSREPKSMSLEQDFLAMIEQACVVPDFIETGTYLGDTTQKATQCFSNVQTIELSEELCNKAKKRFKNNKNIKVHQGDSVTVLLSIIPQLKNKAVFFLDAHYSMGTTAKGSCNTPILPELDAIKTSPIKNHILIIDDIRMFYKSLCPTKNTFIDNYPTLNQIVEKILEINPTYQCAIVYDTLIAFCSEENITVSSVIRALTISRLYEEDNFDIKEVIEAELCIANAQGTERDVLIHLAQTWVEAWSEPAGLSRHIPVWYGLILLAHEEWGKAKAYFIEAKKRGLNHWRIDWYISLAQAECFVCAR